MNQILFTGDKDKKLQINKIVIAFVIIIIIFALFLIGQGVYFFIKRNGKGIAKNNESTNKPEIVATAEGSSVDIIIKNEVAMKNIYYSWKNGEENELNDVEGKKEVSETVLLPNEDTTLNVRIIDENNEEYKFTKEFKYNENVDVVKPKIQLTTTTPGYVSVTVTDNKEISYIEYNWNNDEAVKVKVDDDQKKKMEYNIPAKEGTNKLTVLAVDASRKHRVRRKRSCNSYKTNNRVKT